MSSSTTLSIKRRRIRAVSSQRAPIPRANHHPAEPPQLATRVPSSPLQRFVAEVLGTFLLVLIHGGAKASLSMIQARTHTTLSIPGIAFLALVDGFSLFIIIMIVGKISGVLINPAVTIGLAMRGRFPWNEVPSYLVAQFTGATLGALMILPLMGRDALTIGRLGAVELGPGVGVWQGMLVEMLGTFILVLTISATAVDIRAPSSWSAFAIGMSLAAIVFVFDPFTGAPVNPARVFGPNIIDAALGVPVDWGDYLISYLGGPIIGATIAATLYYYVAGQRRGTPPLTPD